MVKPLKTRLYWAVLSRTKAKLEVVGEPPSAQNRTRTSCLQTAWSWCESESDFKMEIPLKSLMRSIAALSFSLLFLLAVFAHPALAQSDDDASSDNSRKKVVSELSVSPTSLNYAVVNLDNANKLSETKHFKIKNTGKATLDNLVVGAPTNSDYVITTVIPTTLPGKGH